MEYRIAGPAQPGVVSSVCSPHARRDKVPLASAAWLVNAFPTPSLRYQLFPGVGYFHFIRKKERLLLLPRPVRSENRFKSPLHFSTKTKFLLEYGGKVSGPGIAGEVYFLWYRWFAALMPGGHFLWNEPKEAKFASVPLRRHKVRYAPAP